MVCYARIIDSLTKQFRQVLENGNRAANGDRDQDGRDIACLVPCTDGLKLSEPIAAYDPGTEKVSYQAFLERMANSDERCELINGAVYQLASPTYEHQAVVGEIFGIMHLWFKGKSCKPMVAPFDVILRRMKTTSRLSSRISLSCAIRSISTDRANTPGFRPWLSKCCLRRAGEKICF